MVNFDFGLVFLLCCDVILIVAALLFQLYELLISEHSIQYCNGTEGRLRHSTYAKFFSHENMSNYTVQLQQVGYFNFLIFFFLLHDPLLLAGLALFFVVQQLAGELVQGRLAKEAKTQQHIPLYQYMFAFAIKAALLAAFGTKMKDDRTVWKFHQAYEQVSELSNKHLSYYFTVCIRYCIVFCCKMLNRCLK